MPAGMTGAYVTAEAAERSQKKEQSDTKGQAPIYGQSGVEETVPRTSESQGGEGNDHGDAGR